MKTIVALFAAASLAATGFAPASAAGLAAQDQSRTDQGEARKEILPQMRGSEYLGPAYDATARAYRLKFIKDGRVTYIDVDARSGRIINRSN